MALKANGTVYAWGWGQYGQLGNGYTTNSDDTDKYSYEKIYSAPVQVLKRSANKQNRISKRSCTNRCNGEELDAVKKIDSEPALQ